MSAVEFSPLGTVADLVAACVAKYPSRRALTLTAAMPFPAIHELQ
jgi:hypothetical protein